MLVHTECSELLDIVTWVGKLHKSSSISIVPKLSVTWDDIWFIKKNFQDN